MPAKDKKDGGKRQAWLRYQWDTAFWWATAPYHIFIGPLAGLAYVLCFQLLAIVPPEDLADAQKYSNFTLALTLAIMFAISSMKSVITGFLFEPTPRVREWAVPDPVKAHARTKAAALTQEQDQSKERDEIYG